jgi:hypothetical protein
LKAERDDASPPVGPRTDCGGRAGTTQLNDERFQAERIGHSFAEEERPAVGKAFPESGMLAQFNLQFPA